MSNETGAENKTGKTLLQALDDEKAARQKRKADEVQKPPPKRGLTRLTTKQKKFAILGLAIVISIAALTVYAMGSGINPYLTVKQMQARGKAVYGERIRISGLVVDGSIKSDPGRMFTQFVVRDKTGGAKAPVVYKGVVPDNFGNSVEVVLDGSYNGSGFAADNMLTKCPSKYKSAK